MNEFIDQREIQGKGGKAAKFPSGYIVSKLLGEIEACYVLDVTYGEGRFYGYKKPSFLVGCDPKIWSWIVTPDVFIKAPVWHLNPTLTILNIPFDVLVVDPPKWSNVSYNRRDMFDFVLTDSETILKYAYQLAKNLDIPYMLIHYNKILDYGEIVKKIEFRYIARYLNNPEQRTSFFTLHKIKGG